MHRQILEEAAEWFVELNTDDVDVATRRHFDAWLRASPEHVRAFLEMLPLWDEAAALPLDANTTPEQLIAWASCGDNVIALHTASHEPSTGEAAPRSWQWTRGWLAASVVLCALSIGIVWSYRSMRYPTYATALGEQRSLQLADGSTVQLNARSRIRIHYSDGRRDIDLLSGQALFHVAKDPGRPFVVRSGGTEVRAVGTQFDVYKKTGGVVVTVIEGRVAVSGGERSGSGANLPSQNNMETKSYLAAGEQATVLAADIQKNAHANVSEAIAWTKRQLVFDYTPLNEVAEEFNRYNQRHLQIDAPHLGDIKISGVFSSTDSASLVRFLREQPGVKVIESEHAIHIVYE